MNYKLIIGWLYPKLMSTYGDRGNIIALSKRCNWRNIDTEILELDLDFKVNYLKKCDLLFMGGAQDVQQAVVSKDFTKEKINTLKDMVEKEIPGLYICGAYQFLGNYYKEANGNKIRGLSILNLHTENSEKYRQRFIGNIIIDSPFGQLVGFENHGGRTYLGEGIKPLGRVIKGFGNNGQDKTEGIIYKNSIGTYLHGPILPKNPQLADFLIKKALKEKYDEQIELKEIDDSLEKKAHNFIDKKLGVTL